MTKHGPLIPQPLLLIVEQAVLIGGANTTGGTFGTQTQIIAIAIIEAVHFLLDNIGYLADGPLEQLRLLQHRETDFPIAMALHHLLKTGFQILPAR